MITNKSAKQTTNKSDGISTSLLTTLSKLKKAGVIVVADDNGHNYHKLSYYGVNNEIEVSKHSSTFVSGISNVDPFKNTPKNSYSIGNEIFSWDDTSASHFPIDIREYQHSGVNFAGIAHGLFSIPDITTKKIVVVTTLPVSQYLLDSRRNDTLINLIGTKLLNTQLTRLADGENLKIVAHYALPEGLSAIYDWLINDKGLLKKDSESQAANSAYLVIDIGGGTTNVIAVDTKGKLTIVPEKTDSFNNGGIKALKEKIRGLIVESVNDYAGLSRYASGIIPDPVVETMLTDGVILAGGKMIDLSERVNELKSSFWDELVRKIETRCGSIFDYKAAIIAGGGGVLLKSIIKDSVPDAVFLNEYSTSKGVLKYVMNLIGEDVLKKVDGGSDV